MKIDSDSAKVALYSIAGLTLAFFAYSVYKKAKGAGNTLADFGAAIDQTVSDTFANVKKAIANVSDTVSGAAEQFTGERLYVGDQGKGPYKLSPSEYDGGTNAFIKGLNMGKASDFQVFSDGTIIDPYGNYYQMDYSSPASDTPNGFLAKMIYQSPRYSSGVITFN